MEQLADLVRGAGVVLLVVFLAAVILRMVFSLLHYPAHRQFGAQPARPT